MNRLDLVAPSLSRIGTLTSVSRATLLATSLGLAVSSHATQIAWSGATDTAWGTGSNWTGGAAPANDTTTDTALFNLATYPNQPNAGTRSVTGIQIGTGTATGALTLSGTALTLGASGIDIKTQAAATSITSPIVLAANQTWAHASNGAANALTVSGAISGTGNLTRSGSGVVHFTGSTSNTFNGAFNLSTLGGTAALTHTTTYFSKTGGAVAVPDNTILTFGTGTTGEGNLEMGAPNQFGANVELKFNNATSRWARFDLRGTTQTLAGLSCGTTTTAGGAMVQNRPITQTVSYGTATLTLNGAGNYVHHGYLRDADSGANANNQLAIIKDGGGTQTLVGSNITYTGPTTVSGGKLALHNATGFASPSVAVGASGTLELNNTNAAVDNWRVNSLLTGTGTINVNNGTTGWVMTHTHAHTFGGTVNVLGGAFGASFLNSNWSGITADFHIATGALLDARAQTITVGSLNGTGTVGTTWNSNPATVVVGAGNKSGSFAGVITGNATSPTNDLVNPNANVLHLVKTGSGTQTLAGTNTYTGTTTINGGTLAVSGGTAIPDAGTVVLADTAGARLRLDGDETIGSLAGGGLVGGEVDVQGHTLTLAGSASGSFAGTIVGSGGLIKEGSGSLTLSGSSPHAGTTTVNDGTLRLTGTLANGNVVVTDGGTIAGEGSAATIVLGGAGGGALTVNPATPGALAATGALTVNGVAYVALDGAVGTAPFKVIGFGSNPGGFTAENFELLNPSTYRPGYQFAVAANQVTLSVQKSSLEWTGATDLYWDIGFSENFRDTTTLASATCYNADDVRFGDLPTADPVIQIFDPVAPSSMTVESALNYTFSGSPISGGTTLLKAGSGRLTLSSANTFSGGTVIRQGEVRTGNNDALGSGTVTLGDASTGSAAVSWLFQGGGTPANPVVVSALGSGTVTLGTHSTGNFTGPTGSLTLHRAVTLQDGTNDRTSYLGKISGNPGTITLTGSRVTFDNAANDFTGNVAVGASTIYQNNVAGAAPDAATFTLLGSGSRFRLNSNSETIGGLNGTGIVDNVTGTGNTLTLGGGNQSGSFAGSVTNGSGVLHLAKTGTGSQAFTGTLNHTGTTAVTGGTLQLPGGSTLSGGITAADGTTVAVGTGTGSTLNAASLTLGTSAGATLSIRNFASAASVPLNVTGALTTSGTVSVKVSGQFNVGTFPLIDYGTLAGAGYAAIDLDEASLPRGVVATLVQDTTAGIINLQVTAASSLVWVGDESQLWDINTTGNWTLGGVDANYLDGDTVRFDDSASSGAVTLNTQVNPGAVTFANTTAKAYTVTGSGGIAGASGIVKSGDGTVTLATANPLTGTTTVSAGTLNLGNGSSDGWLGGALVNNATVNFNTVGTTTQAGSLSGSGTIHKNGAGTLALTGANAHTGAFNVNEGTLQIGSGGANGNPGTSNYTLDADARIHLAYNTAVLTAAANGYLSKIAGGGKVELSTNQGVNGSANWGPNSATGAPFQSGFNGTLQVNLGRIDAPPAGLGSMSAMIIKDGAQFLAWTGNYMLPIEIAGNGWGETGFPGALRVAGGHNATWQGAITLTGNAGILSQTDASLFTLTGPITGPYECDFIRNGTIVVAPSVPVQNSYGSTKISSSGGSGTVRAGNAHAFSTGALVMNGGVLALNGFDFSFAELSGATGQIQNGSATTSAIITVGADNASTSYDGLLANGGTAKLALVKTGTGTLTLNGQNTYTGNTTVAGGTLSLFRDYLADNSTVTIASGAKLDLNTDEATDTVAALVLGNTTMAPGTYNAVTHPDYFTGDGSLIVGGAYDTWAAAKGLTGPDALTTADPDKDGVANLLEFYLDGNPLASDSSILPDQQLNGTYLTLTFQRRDDAAADVTGQVVEYGNNLGSWLNAAIGTAEGSSTDANGVVVTVTANGANPDDIEVKIPRTPHGASGKLFARLKVTE